jgi:two-component system chemotaxis response regulator CheB
MIKTLIVDDSPLVRTIIKDFLESDGSFHIIGEAENGQDGVNLAQHLEPDLITMDIEMPVMNGLEAITEIRKSLTSAIVVISTHDTAKMAYDATVKGAEEFYSKDVLMQMNEQQREQILSTLKHITNVKKRISVYQDKASGERITSRRIKAVVIASSTGGPKALSHLCTYLPKDFPVPIILVQHNSSGFDLGFVQWLNGFTELNVCLAQKGTIPVKGNFYVAPTDKHLLVSKTGFLLDNGDPVNSQKPAADLLFNSASELYGESLISVVLTGMGRDGADGSRFVKKGGGITIAQNEESSLIFGMPKAAIETGCIDTILPLDLIAQQLISLTGGN